MLMWVTTMMLTVPLLVKLIANCYLSLLNPVTDDAILREVEEWGFNDFSRASQADIMLVLSNVVR